MPDDIEVETTTPDPEDETTEDQKQVDKPTDGESPEQVRARLETAEARIKELNKESTDRRKKLEKYESDEKKRKESEMSELEKAQTRLAELEAGIQQRDAALRDNRIRTAVERTATKLKFRDPEDAYTMLLPKLGEIEPDQDGNVKEAEDLLKQLAKAKPYLIDNGTDAPDIDSRTDSKKKAEKDEEELRRRYNLG